MLRKPSFEPFDYVPRALRDRPEEERVTFHLRRLSWNEKAALGKRARLRMDDQGNIEALETDLTIARRVLDLGLLGWDGEGEDGSLRCERRREKGRDVLTDDVLDAIEPYAIELANAIERGSELSEEAEKNS